MIKNNSKILIIRLSALGDCIHTLPLLNSIKGLYPNCFCGWVCEEGISSVLENHPLIDKLYIFPKKEFKAKNFIDKIKFLIEFSKEIKKENYDIVIDSQELFKSAVLSFLSGGKLRLAHKNSREFADWFATKRIPARKLFATGRHVVERNMDFLKFLGHREYNISFPLKTISSNSLKKIDAIFTALDKDKKTIVISPTTTWSTKHWEIDNWKRFIPMLSKFNLIFTGTANDIEYISEILKDNNTSNIVNLAGKTSLEDLRAVFQKSDFMISLDSGSTHLAAANPNLKIIALFGATSEIRNGAYGMHNVNLRKDLCPPCYKKFCKKYNTPYCKCLSSITPEELFYIVKTEFK